MNITSHLSTLESHTIADAQTELRDWITNELFKEPAPLLPLNCVPIKNNTKKHNEI